MTAATGVHTTANLAQAQAEMLQALFASGTSGDTNTSVFIATDVVNKWTERQYLFKNGPRDSFERGWQAYRAHASALAERALSAAYPTVSQTVKAAAGEGAWAALAKALWREASPASGDVAAWGGALAAFLHRSSQWCELLIDFPHLAALAKTEWALHRCAALPDAQPALPGLALLAEADPANLWLMLAPGTEIVAEADGVATALATATDATAAADLSGPAEHAVTLSLHPLDEAAHAIVVWRQGFKPCWRGASAAEAAFVQAVLRGESLSQSLNDALGVNALFDFQAWLVLAVQNGLLLAAQEQPTAPARC